jgi:hypothetical protein
MDIPNLSPSTPSGQNNSNLSKIRPFFVVAILAIASGFLFSRLSPSSPGSSVNNPVSFTNGAVEQDDIKVGIVYGDESKTFKDSATGILKASGVNGEGTHHLEREGGETQKVALTSSSVDLDLFIDRTVEIRGQTNSSTKAGWFVDVYTIKIVQ